MTVRSIVAEQGTFCPPAAVLFRVFGVAVDGGTDEKRKPRETARAVNAFADYVALGPGRSIRKLHDAYVIAAGDGKPAENVRQLERWSADHNWQGRLAAMEADRLAAGQEIRTALYLRALTEYDRRTDGTLIEAAPLDAIHAIYDRVRPTERSGADIAINLTATVELVGVDPGDV